MSDLGRARNPVTRSMWVLILFIGIIATTYHLYWIIIEYYNYEVRTTIMLSPTPKVRINLISLFYTLDLFIFR